jgi:predicted transcriptional regulator
MTRVGELEAAVMQHLWRAGEGRTVRQVHAALEHPREPLRELAYTTVMTVMERLYRKGLLVREPQGKAYLYSAAASQADYTAQVMAQALSDASDRTAALVHFAGQLSGPERSALRQALTAKSRSGRQQ